MNRNVLVMLVALFALSVPVRAQWNIYFYVGLTQDWGESPLTEDCTPAGVCIPDGRLIAIFEDANDNGPDAADTPWPPNRCAYNAWMMNGTEVWGVCGTAISEEWEGYPPTPHQGYLRVYCDDNLHAQYVSPLFTCGVGLDIMLPFDSWQCSLCGGGGNAPPVAFIDSITPNPARLGQNVTFRGRGDDPDGTVIGHEWRSDIDGFLSEQPTFSTSALSVGVHHVSFRVMDDDSAWSVPLSRVLPVVDPADHLYYPSDDAMISQGSPDYNCGDCDYLEVRNFDGSGTWDHWGADAMIRIDMSSYPQNISIDSALLFLYYYRWWDNQPANRALSLRRVLGEWNEATVTWNTAPDYSMELVSATVPAQFGWMSWDVTGDVRDFINGVTANYGWRIIDETRWGMSDIPCTYFYSREYVETIPFLRIYSEVTVRGVVRRFQTDEPLSEVLVYASNQPDTVRTNDNGEYGLHLPAGSHILHFHRAEHCDAILTDVTVSADSVTHADAVLSWPRFQRSHTSLSMVVAVNQDTSADFVLHNTGFCEMHFAISDTSNWLEALPASGTISAGDSLSITAVVHGDRLPPGDNHWSEFRIAHDGADSPYSLRVDLWVVSASPLTRDLIPRETALLPGYPNPFNASTTIPFDLSRAARVSLRMYNLQGQTVSSFYENRMLAAGHYHVRWDGSQFASGVYLCRLEVDGNPLIRKLILLR